jgi:alpha-beta hydrolase superfamily lysophospholipase
MFRAISLIFLSAFITQSTSMEPLSDSVYHIRGVAPKGWQQVRPGVYARNGSPGDAIQLIQQSAPVAANILVSGIGTQLGLNPFPSSNGTLQSNDLNWTLYRVSSVNTPAGKAAAEIAIAELSGTTYLVMLTAPADQIAPLRENVFSPAVKALAPMKETLSLAPDEQEVTFTSGPDTIYGTMLVPKNRTKLPAALLISGSGPTDRDGNSALLPGKVDSQKTMARILGDQGVASLRFDKIGTGKTGLASFASHLEDLDFNTYTATARAGLQYLRNRSEIDPSRILILGHSEGALISLVLASNNANQAKALALINGLSKPYLQTIRDQATAGVSASIAAGQMSPSQGEQILSALDSIGKTLVQTGMLPDAAQIPPALRSLFVPANAKFLATVSQYDAGLIAASLPKTLPVLVTCGEKDIQIPCSDVQNVLDGFRRAGNNRVTSISLKNSNHVLKVVEGESKGTADYVNPDLQFSDQMKQALIAFVKANL